MPTQKVDIGIACAPNQTPQWWAAMMARLLEADQDPEIEIGAIRQVSTALPDHRKNRLLESKPPADESVKNRNNLTDSNRQEIVRGFMFGDADWLWQVDDDTVPPPGALKSLLAARRDFIAGTYFLGGYPHNPIAYRRLPDGTYAAVLTYPAGTMIEVDSVGMGCTLIHRSVFDKIKEAHEVLVRPNGSLIPVLKEHISGDIPDWDYKHLDTYVEDGVLQMPLRRRVGEDSRPWPFYALEYGRTEDHHFCELAAAVGVKPWLDTNIVCEHIKSLPVGLQHHKGVVRKMAREGIIDG